MSKTRKSDACFHCSIRFAKIRIKMIEPAVKELIEKDDWLIQWDAIKAGRKVVNLRFTFMRNPQPKLPF